MKSVEVRLYSSLRKYHLGPNNSEALTITMDDEAKLGNLFNDLNITEEQITVALVNGRSKERSYLLQEGDRIALFPIIGGG